MRALEVADSAQKNPTHFAELALEYSDDEVTRPLGGSLGGLRAGQLPPEFLDALAALKPGQISRVIRTAFGYHVLERRPIPADNQVSGKRIAIRYVGTVGGPEGVAIARTRDDAKKLAHSVVALAKSGPGTWDSLVTEYSDNADKAEGGDIGSWSLRDPGFLPREIERLGSLLVGEVSEPLDSPFGFEVLARTPAEPRARYAMTAIQIAFDPSVPAGQRGSEAGAWDDARKLAKEVADSPARFEEVRVRICCTGTQQWTDGRGPPGVTPVLLRLAPGEIASTPVQLGRSYAIIRRLDPAGVPTPPGPKYELPHPKGPDFDAIVTYTDGAALARDTRNLLSTDVVRALQLDHATGQAVRATLEKLAASFEAPNNTAASRLAAWHGQLEQLQRTLGSEGFARFNAFLNTWATQQMLAGGG